MEREILMKIYGPDGQLKTKVFANRGVSSDNGNIEITAYDEDDGFVSPRAPEEPEFMGISGFLNEGTCRLVRAECEGNLAEFWG